MMIGLAGLATLGGIAYLGSRVWAQAPQQYAQPGQPAAAVQPAAPVVTRVALVNLGQVIKNLQKFKKLMNGACWPMYIAPGMDITADITNILNQRYASVTTPPAVSGQR